jgi:hypothetical protein
MLPTRYLAKEDPLGNVDISRVRSIRTDSSIVFTGQEFGEFLWSDGSPIISRHRLQRGACSTRGALDEERIKL